jgi:hypothetical protein
VFRIRIRKFLSLPDSYLFINKIKKKLETLIFTMLRLLNIFLSLKTDLNVDKVIIKNKLLFGILKATEEKSRIRIRSKTDSWHSFFLIGFCSVTLVLRDEGVAVRHPVGGSWHHAAAQHFPLQLLHPPLPVQAARRTLSPSPSG